MLPGLYIGLGRGQRVWNVKSCCLTIPLQLCLLTGERQVADDYGTDDWLNQKSPRWQLSYPFNLRLIHYALIIVTKSPALGRELYLVGHILSLAKSRETAHAPEIHETLLFILVEEPYSPAPQT